MNKEQKIWIQGNPERGKDVISKLESLGGKNIRFSEDGTRKGYIYYIFPDGSIAHNNDLCEMTAVIKDNYTEYKLPEKFSFKPFDKVLIKLYDGIWLASHYSCEDENWFYITGGVGYEKKHIQVVPYNKETEYLLGTHKVYNPSTEVRDHQNPTDTFEYMHPVIDVNKK